MHAWWSEGGAELVELAGDGGGGTGEEGDPVGAVAGFAGEEVAAVGGVVDADDMVGTAAFLEAAGAGGAKVGGADCRAGKVCDGAGLGLA